MRTHATVAALATAGTLFGALLGGQDMAVPPARSAVEDPEAYAVWATLLSDHWLVRHAGAKTLVIQQETTTDRDCGRSEGLMETDWRPVLDSYTAANAAVHTVLAGDRLGRPYIVVPSDEIRAFFKRPYPGDGWSEFHRRYPDSRGYVQVSVVGFDAERKRAMAYLAHRCGGLCGGGTRRLLEKVDGKWRESKPPPGVEWCSWVS